MIEMVNIIEEYARMIEYPSRCVERRSFLVTQEIQESKVAMDRFEGWERNKSPLAVFQLKLEHRYHDSWQGSGENLLTGGKVAFTSFLELLKIFEAQLSASRECKLTMALENGKNIVEIRGQIFIIQVLFREHETWQGILYWTEKKMQMRFRSYLEMLQLLDEATAVRNEGKVKDFRKVANR